MTTVNNTYNCTQLVLNRVICMAKLYNFDDMTMTTKNGNKNQRNLIQEQHSMPTSLL